MSIEIIKRSASAKQLAVILGAGVTMSLMPRPKRALGWSDLILNGISYTQERRLISPEQADRQKSAVASTDIDEMLGVAEFIGRKLGAPKGVPYARWLQSVFSEWKPTNIGMINALKALYQQGSLMISLNYDTVAAAAIGATPIDLSDTDAALSWFRRERLGLLHLHGIWSRPETCIFGVRDYQHAVTNEVRSLLQRSLTSLNRVLFIGCGDTLADPNFSSLLSWLRQHVGAGTLQHFALVRDEEVELRLADANWQGFVEPIAYGEDHTDLPDFLLRHFPTRRVRRVRSAPQNAVDKHLKVLEAYKTFLLRDCGEMTIEGMRADMDTAQRKFNLEKLFVPLDVQAIPPAIGINDEQGNEKLRIWREKNAEAIPFSRAFAQNTKIALLALPGGGKTLLLKRLAVAYSDKLRREASSDRLPSLDLVPIMLKCREWKEHIRKPFKILLKEMCTITGDVNLNGLGDALEKTLRAGSVLLLVDGLDEIHDNGDRQIFVDNLEKFVDLYPKIRLVISSREAGFDLVAPCVARFCIRFKIAPLSNEAINLLSNYWHNLMSSSSVSAQEEADSVANALLYRPSLRRLAENPLLLTMLLVVKHGAGRLPPDRVNLYDRAVDILLDTWNIQGHEPLNTKEAVPQLACLAFELMKRRVQTATQKEILEILQSARIQLPTIGRYAKDSPYDFLKRVELRSSLLLEGGHTNEDGRIVPFYQFRHLTFQEYLSAVAAVEGYVLDEGTSSSPLQAIGSNLFTEEWKEVVPMAAVLARNQAGPLLEAVTDLAQKELADEPTNLRTRNALGNFRLPPATSLLAQSMVEEAIFPPSTLERAAKLVTYYIDITFSQDNLRSLTRGPYAVDLTAAVFYNWSNATFFRRSAARNTLAAFAASSAETADPNAESSLKKISQKLAGQDQREKILAIATVGGSFLSVRNSSPFASSTKIYESIELALFDIAPEVHLLAAWSWGFWRHLKSFDEITPPIPRSETIHRLISIYIEGLGNAEDDIGFVIAGLRDVNRSSCQLLLKDDELVKIRHRYESLCSQQKENIFIGDNYALLRIIYLLPQFYSDEELKSLVETGQRTSHSEWCSLDIFNYLGIQLPYRRRSSHKKAPKIRQSP